MGRDAHVPPRSSRLLYLSGHSWCRWRRFFFVGDEAFCLGRCRPPFGMLRVAHCRRKIRVIFLLLCFLSL